MVAIKIMRSEEGLKGKEILKLAKKETEILKSLNHKNVIRIVDFGSDGYVKKPSGKEIKGLVYIILEYVSCGLLFDLCHKYDQLGEDIGRFFMS